MLLHNADSEVMYYHTWAVYRHSISGQKVFQCLEKKKSILSTQNLKIILPIDKPFPPVWDERELRRP